MEDEDACRVSGSSSIDNGSKSTEIRQTAKERSSPRREIDTARALPFQSRFDNMAQSRLLRQPHHRGQQIPPNYLLYGAQHIDSSYLDRYVGGAVDVSQVAGGLPYHLPSNFRPPVLHQPQYPFNQPTLYSHSPEGPTLPVSSDGCSPVPPLVHHNQYAYGSPQVHWTPESIQSGMPPYTGLYASYSAAYPEAFLLEPESSGPPRKPRQSGHALWVGNLPLKITVTDLKDHFAREATNEIESVKLISKSSCAFVNYRTAASCRAALVRFHESLLHGVRIICRLRQASNATTAVDQSCTKSNSDAVADAETPVRPHLDDDADGSLEQQPSSGGLTKRGSSTRYFVLKSLTLRDLELCIQSGVWATQPHNERILNEAYKSADHVYLIFSVNKSGEYFGYARMASEIFDDAGVNTLPKLGTSHADVHNTKGPKVLKTRATEWAPAGRIIDDSARGTVFWEAAQDRETESMPVEGTTTSNVSQDDDSVNIANSTSRNSIDSHHIDAEELLHLSGRSFKVQWISTKKVPFYRTRGLRNRYNSNKEVKIARDGTEVETSTAEKLLALFGPQRA